MDKNTHPKQDSESIRSFTKALLADLRAMEMMVRDGMMESGIRRFGCEQEMFLVDRAWRPTPMATKILELLDHENFTTELALFNLEMNIEPMLLKGKCFTELEERLEELLDVVRGVAHGIGTEVVLSGILPTLNKSDLHFDNMTPDDRYYTLNQALTKMRGGAYRLQIEGRDELYLEHDSVMLEACNASCQVHLQVDVDDFADMYNLSQAVLGPVVAASANSPLLFGKRLWAETRIALFQQSLDTRSTTVDMRQLSPRVRFGERWVDRSVTELFQEDIVNFEVILTQDYIEDPFEKLAEGCVPKLQALQLHNSTVYRWNRPCYGILDGKAHLRIECRALPSGPTTLDEVANAVFWIGLVRGAREEYGDITKRLDFDDAKYNFLVAARQGLNAGFHWIDDKRVGASELILDTLIPLARSGLSGRVESSDLDKYLGVIQARVESRSTGSDWMIRSLNDLKQKGTYSECLSALTAATVSYQTSRKPCHEWELARLDETGGWTMNYTKVEQYMITELFTVQEDELLEMVAFLMDRKQIRHVPVEDDQHHLVGLVSYRSILRMLSDFGSEGIKETIPVKLIMDADPITVAPETSTLEAIDIMRQHGVSCLPVVKGEKLVGLVSEADFMAIAYQLLEDKLIEDQQVEESNPAST